MFRHPTRLVVLAVLALVAVHADAQKLRKLYHLADSILTARYWRSNIDTNYVTRPETKWTIVGQYNLAGARLRIDGTSGGQTELMDFTTDVKSTVSVNVSYRGLSLSCSVNPAKLWGKYDDTELSFRSYGRSFGFDLTYQDANNFEVEFTTGEDRQKMTLPDNIFRLQTLNINAYYAFNNHRFSYPAAFSHSYIQRRSAGGFLLGASIQAQHGHMEANDMQVDFRITNYALGVGYGYNFVPGRRWLIHFSTLPTIVIYNKTSLSSSDTSYPFHNRFPEFIVTTRFSVVKQISNSLFAGLSSIYYFTHIGRNDQLTFSNQKWISRVYLGFRL